MADRPRFTWRGDPPGWWLICRCGTETRTSMDAGETVCEGCNTIVAHPVPDGPPRGSIQSRHDKAEPGRW